MKTTRLFTLTAAALLSSAIGFAQAGAVDALKKFIMTPTVSAATSAKPFTAKRKLKPHTVQFKNPAPGLVQMGIHQTLQTNHRRRRQKPFGSMT